ncbi:MAG: hypothetical protein IT342_14720 [Candidatus Melainabacteria bacterium]|nr:hypothetical protein [Candidatus Melainabacteria bacterium]
MNTVEQASLDHRDQDSSSATTEHATSPATVEQSQDTPDLSFTSDENAESMDLTPPKISGFDGGTRSFLKEPSLYLSIAIVAVANWVCLNKTPNVFWVSFAAMTAVAIVFHVVAERFLFRSKKEYTFFKAPFEGVFVLTFGSILPGLGLLAYAVYSLSTAVRPNVLEILGKLALLLVVPIFNFAVWSSVRRGYLVRPRYIGLMNGFALGLSASWTIIWLKALISQGDSSCKFGWMLLLCSAPFLLFAAACLSHDLWQKTETNIRKISTTFSVLGCLLSFLFVFTPMVRTFFVQSQLNNARIASPSDQAKAISVLRSVATDEDLRPSKYPVSGLSLASLLIPNRGLDTGSEGDQNLYFKITGKSYYDVSKSKALENEQLQSNIVAGYKIPGLSLVKSLISGNIDASTFSSSVDWALTFHNSSSETQEAIGEIGLPKDAVVSRVTLWIDGEPREAAFASNSRVQAAYEAVVNEKRDPLLVTMPAPDRVQFRCFPLPANGGEMKIRLGFKVPLETTDGKVCSMELPKLLSSNFAPPKRHRVSLFSRDLPVRNIAGITTIKNANGYTLGGIIKTNDKDKSINSVAVQRTTAFTEVATPDWFSKEPRYIVERLREVTAPAPKRLLVVVDTSASLKRHASDIKQALACIPARLKPAVFFAKEQIPEKDVSANKNNADTISDAEQISNDDEISDAEEIATKQKSDATPGTAKSQSVDENQNAGDLNTARKDDASVKEHTREPANKQANEQAAKSIEEAQSALGPELFVGGQDNGAALREAVEVAAEQPNSAVLWIHGPQPLRHNLAEPKALDLVHHVSLYDMQIKSGPNTLPQALQVEDIAHLMACKTIPHDSPVKDLKKLVRGWEKGVTKLAIQRTQTTKRPQTALISDRTISSQVTCLWASGEAARLAANGQEHEAIKLASRYRLVSPLTGAVVLESSKLYKANKLDPGDYKSGVPFGSTSGGSQLVGAPVDPRFGQSNEVGQLADLGYDTARDIARILTAISALISMIVAVALIRGQKSITRLVIAKAIILMIAAPTIIHLMGTFVINNFGGLGGGL